MKILKVNSKNPEIDKIKAAAGVIRNGGVVIFPTETVYGLGACPFDRKAVDRIYKLKGRSFKKPLAVLVSDAKQITPLVRGINKRAKELIKKYMPGPLTLVFKKSKRIPGWVTAGKRTIGIRMPDHTFTKLLIKTCGTPIVATSANRSGGRDPRTAREALNQLKRADLLIDGGKTRIGKPSTVIDVSSPRPVILRQGSLTPTPKFLVLG